MLMYQLSRKRLLETLQGAALSPPSHMLTQWLRGGSDDRLQLGWEGLSKAGKHLGIELIGLGFAYSGGKAFARVVHRHGNRGCWQTCHQCSLQAPVDSTHDQTD